MEEKKDYILDIARSRFERFGFKKTSMDEISKDAGISKKTVYELFKNKEDLFVSLFIREAHSNLKYMLSKVDNTKDPLENIKQLLRVAVSFHQHESFMVKVLKDENGLYAPFLKEKYRLQVEGGVLDVFLGILRKGMEKGEFRNLDPYAVSYFIFKLFQAVTYAKTASVKGNPELLDEFIDFILQGILPKK